MGSRRIAPGVRAGGRRNAVAAPQLAKHRLGRPNHPSRRRIVRPKVRPATGSDNTPLYFNALRRLMAEAISAIPAEFPPFRPSPCRKSVIDFRQPWGPPCPAARAGAGGGTPRHPGPLMPLRAGRGRQIRPACYPSVRGRRPIYVKLHGSVLHAIFGVELLTATAPVWLRLSGFVACIARKVIPRVRPPVCCVQYTAPSRHIACNVHCTPSLHAINRPHVAQTSQKLRNEPSKPENGLP